MIAFVVFQIVLVLVSTEHSIDKLLGLPQAFQKRSHG